MANRKPQDNPHARAMEEAKKSAKTLSLMEILDSIPEGQDPQPEIPFPYGGHAPNPDGWEPSPWPD